MRVARAYAASERVARVCLVSVWAGARAPAPRVQGVWCAARVRVRVRRARVRVVRVPCLLERGTGRRVCRTCSSGALLGRGRGVVCGADQAALSCWALCRLCCSVCARESAACGVHLYALRELCVCSRVRAVTERECCPVLARPVCATFGRPAVVRSAAWQLVAGGRDVFPNREPGDRTHERESGHDESPD